MSVMNLLVIVTEPIHSNGIKILESSGVDVFQLPPGSDEDALMEQAAKVDALITRGSINITREFLIASPILKVIGVHGVGCDHIDLNSAKERNVIVLNTPTALTDTVAEMTLGLILSLTRKIIKADNAVRAGEWNLKYSDLVGSELMGKTIGIIGLGRIGIAVARRLKPFDVKMLCYDVVDKSHMQAELGLKQVGFEKLLKDSDIITIHTPLTSQTQRLISKKEIGLMKDGVYIVNMSRGRVIDQYHLTKALQSGKVAGAALDVFEEEPLDIADPLTSLKNVILTPHIGASTVEAMRRMAVKVAQEVLKVLNGEAPENPVVI